MLTSGLHRHRREHTHAHTQEMNTHTHTHTPKPTSTTGILRHIPKPLTKQEHKKLSGFRRFTQQSNELDIPDYYRLLQAEGRLVTAKEPL